MLLGTNYLSLDFLEYLHFHETDEFDSLFDMDLFLGLTKASSHVGCFLHSPGHSASNFVILQGNQSADCSSTRRANRVSQDSRVISFQDHLGGTVHNLGRTLLGNRVWHAHLYCTVREGLDHEEAEGGAASAECGCDVHELFVHEQTSAGVVEDPGNGVAD